MGRVHPRQRRNGSQSGTAGMVRRWQVYRDASRGVARRRNACCGQRDQQERETCVFRCHSAQDLESQRTRVAAVLTLGVRGRCDPDDDELPRADGGFHRETLDRRCRHWQDQAAVGMGRLRPGLFSRDRRTQDRGMDEGWQCCCCRGHCLRRGRDAGRRAEDRHPTSSCEGLAPLSIAVQLLKIQCAFEALSSSDSRGYDG